MFQEKKTIFYLTFPIQEEANKGEWDFKLPQNGIYISPEILEEIGMRQKEMKKLIIDHFYHPISMSEICSIAEELETEEEFFRQHVL